MRVILAVVLLLMTFRSARAGEISGTIRLDRRPIAAGTRVEVVCGTARYATTTRQFGGYLLTVPRSGRCRLTVFVGPPALRPRVDIISYHDATTYNIDITRSSQGYQIERLR